ncbi:MAG: O-antigen ligase family protein [Aerococcus sp.]|nr:O-antigen ligase family protein [Aerococcus sp.]
MLKKIIHWGTDLYLFRLVTLLIYTMYSISSLFNIESIPRAFTLVWGGILILFEVFYARRFQQAKYWPLLALFVVAYGITVLLNIRYQTVFMINNLFYIVQTAVLFYPIELDDSKDRFKIWLQRINTAFNVIVFLASLASVLLYVFNISYWIFNAGDNSWIRQGFVESRLFGVYANPNVGSIYAAAAIAMLAENNVLKGRKIYQFSGWGIFNIVVQIAYIALSASRGTLLTGMVFIGLLFVFYMIRSLMKQFTWRRLGTLFFQGVLTLFLVVSAYAGVEKAISYAPGITNYGYQLVTGNLAEEEENGIEGGAKASFGNIQATTLRTVDENSEVSSGRITIWKAGLNVLKQKPLFGTGDTVFYRNRRSNETTTQIDMQKLTELDRRELVRSRGYLHNGYVTALVRSGIVGAALYFLFLAAFFIYHLRFLLSKQFDMHNTWHQLYAMIFAMLVSFLFTDLVEAHLMYNNHDVINLIFWLNAGVLNYLNYQFVGEKYLGRWMEKRSVNQLMMNWGHQYEN